MLVRLKWYGINQNNSGGYIIENDFVGSDIFIQATSPEEAEEKALRIVSDYSEYCHCCGERWYINFDESDGNSEPCKYGEPLSVKYKPYGEYAVLHHYDGTITRIYGDK